MLAQKHTVELSLWRFLRGVKTVDFQSLFIIGLSLLSSCDTVEIGMRDLALLGHLGVCTQSFSHGRLCDPMDCSLPGSSVPGESPGKNTGVGCHCLLKFGYLYLNK